MMRNRFYFLLSFVIGLFFLLPAPALAQNIDPADILQTLAPRDGRAFIYDVFLYLLFIIGFVNQFLIPDKQLLISMLNFAVMGFAVASKLLIVIPLADPSPATCYNLPPGAFEFSLLPSSPITFAINLGVFVFPLLMAGGLRAVKGKRPKAFLPSIIMALLGGGYFFVFWALEQRPCSDVPQPRGLPGPAGSSIDVWLVYLSFGLLMVKQGWRRR